MYCTFVPMLHALICIWYVDGFFWHSKVHASGSRWWNSEKKVKERKGVLEISVVAESRVPGSRRKMLSPGHKNWYSISRKKGKSPHWTYLEDDFIVINALNFCHLKWNEQFPSLLIDMPILESTNGKILGTRDPLEKLSRVPGSKNTRKQQHY